MFNLAPDLKRHARELLRRLRGHQYEKSPNGLLFPKMNLFVGGFFLHGVNRGDLIRDHNLVPTQGLNHLLDAVLGGGTQITEWYGAPYTNNVSPQASTTAANFHSTLVEFTGYSEGVRQTLVFAAAAAGVVTNEASLAEFTITGAATLRGGGVLSVATRESTDGTCFAATAFSVARGVVIGDTFQLGYECAAANEA